MFLPTFMSHQYGPSYKDHSLFPIFSAERLLSGRDQQRLMGQIRQRLGHFSDVYYQAFYGSLIERFAEFVQMLPLMQGGPLGGILNMGLERGLLALDFLAETGVQQDNELMAYAVFSSALLQDIGLTTTSRRLMVCDKEGAFIQEWLPHYAANMRQCGEFFKMRYYHDSPVGMNFLLAPLYARRVMPPVGYAWIADHPAILVQWLASLGRVEAQSGGMGQRLNMIETRLQEMLNKRMKPLTMHVDVFEPEGTAIGEAFWKWLREGLLAKEIPVNETDAGVYRVEEGVLLEHSKIFEDFCKAYSEYRDWVVVAQQFNMLGLTKLSGGDVRFEQYFSQYPWKQGEQLAGGVPKQKPEGSARPPSGLFDYRPDHQLAKALSASSMRNATAGADVESQRQYALMKGVLVPSAYLFPEAAMPQIDPRLTAKESQSGLRAFYSDFGNRLEVLNRAQLHVDAH